MAGGVGGGVPLDRDLGNVLDMMVNLVSNMVDNWGSMSNGNGSSMSICGNWSSMSIGGNWGGMSIGGNWGSMSNGGDSWSGNGMSSRVDTSDKTMSKGSSNKTMSIGSSKEVLSISISNWGSKATANKSREDNKALHLDQC